MQHEIIRLHSGGNSAVQTIADDNPDHELILLVAWDGDDKPPARPAVQELHRGEHFDLAKWKEGSPGWQTCPAFEKTRRVLARLVLDALDSECDGGYWWCPNCKEEVDGGCVTYAEFHQDCGHPVEWIRPASIDLAAMVTALRAVGPAVMTITNKRYPDRVRRDEAERIMAMAQSALDLARSLPVQVPCRHGSWDGMQCCALSMSVEDVGAAEVEHREEKA